MSETDYDLPDDDWAWVFFESYTSKEHPVNLTQAARAAGVSRHKATDRRSNDPIFSAMWDAADAAIYDAVISSLMGQAINGREQGVYRKGALVDTVHTADVATQKWVLERLNPELWHLSTRVEHVVGANDGAEFKFQMGEAPLEIEGSASEE